MNKELAALLESATKDELIVDLGAGTDGGGYAVADSLKAAGYIGVEMNFAEFLNERIEAMKGNTPHIVVQGDMGKFLRNFPSIDVKPKLVIFSGIDRYSYKGSLSYDKLLREIHNVLDQQGILVVGGNMGYMREDYLDELEGLFEEIDVGDSGNYSFYRKRL